MTKYRTEYRINKKGAECFRTMDFTEMQGKLEQLSAKRPGVYTWQSRSVQLQHNGMAASDCSGRTLWTAWM